MIKVKLKNISKQISSGLTPSRSNPDFWKDGNIFWLKTEQLGEKYIYETTEKITSKAVNETSIKLYPQGTLAIAMYGEGRTRGNVSIIRREMATNQACCNVILDSKKADYEFVYYYLKTQYSNLRSLSSGVRKNLNSNDIKEFEITLPDSVNEQQKIAAILSVLDDKIEINNQINTELGQMAKTLYDYWFVQFDFPSEKGKPYKSSGGKMVYNEDLKREIPKGWEVKKLYQIANITMGQSPSGESYNEEGQGIIFFQGSTDFGWRYPDERMFTTAPTRIAKEGDILLSVRAPIGTMNMAMSACCIGRGLSAISSKEGFNSFLFYQMNYFKKKFDYLNSVGTTFGSLTKDDLYNLELSYPSKEILNQFESLVSRFDEKILINTKENQQLAALRDWLLPMLMNGQVKVTDNVAIAATPQKTHRTIEPLNIPANKKTFAKQVLAGKIVATFIADPNFTDIKFQKVQFLAEHFIEADLNLNYYYQAAGPYDNKFMHTIYGDFRKQKWFDCKNKRFIPLEKQEKIEGYYQGYFAAAQKQLENLFDILFQATEAEAEIIATLYAIWNDRIIDARQVTDEELIADFYGWSDRKQRYSKSQIENGLSFLRRHQMEPRGFGQLIKRSKIKN